MSERAIYDVIPRGERWAVKGRGAKRAVGVFDDKKDAVRRAKDIAKRWVESQVVIRKQDGTIQTEHTYGTDPFPPRG
jgi:hypothetical protein